MMQEDYVSFETAKLLKEKGFPQYKKEDSYVGLKYNKDGELTTAPFAEHYRVITQAKAMRWLREVHNLCIELYRTACGYLYTISTIPYGSCKYNPKEGGDDEDSGQWTSYEGACEAAIKYCLENLV